MSQNLVVVQQYLSWKGHYKQYFENLHDPEYHYLYSSNGPEDYKNACWIKSSFDSDKPLTIKSKIKGRFFDSFRVFRKLSNSDYDVIHLIEFEPLTYLLFSNKIKEGAKLIITIHSSDRLHFTSWINNKLSGFQRWLLEVALKKAMRKGAEIVTHYDCHRESIIEVIGEEFRNKVNMIHYPAPKPDSDRTKVLRQSSDPGYLIYGQIREDKGIYEFLKNESTKTLRITIAGKIVDQRIFEFSSRLNLNIIDKFLTEDEITELVNNHDFMLLPYPLEYTNGAGTFKDSLAKAMPVVCSNISIFREIIDAYHVGLLFENPDSIDRLVRNIHEAEYERLSQNCLNYALEYDWTYMRKAYFALYEKLLEADSVVVA